MEPELIECGLVLAGTPVERVTSFELVEEVSGPSRLFAWVADLDFRLAPDRLLGQPASLWFGPQGGDRQEFSGVVAGFTPHASREENSAIAVEVVDPFQVRCACHAFRAFEDRSLTEVLQSVLGQNKVAVSVQGDAPHLTTRIQFGESDKEFISRLLEEYGFFYYLDGTTLKVADDSTKPTRGQVAVSWYTGGVEAFGVRHVLVPLKHRGVSYRYETEMRARPEFSVGGGGPAGQSVSATFFGPAVEANLLPCLGDGDLERLERVRGERAAARTSQGEGRSTAVAVRPAATLEFKDLPRADLNGKYFVTAVTHRYAPDASGGAPVYTNVFTCVPAATRFRPPLSAPRARADGVHVGTVVAPSAGAADDLKAGRVRVALSWMGQEGLQDPLCRGFSCWSRVLHAHAGDKHGTVFLPELGDEVLVAFEDGDPDRPVVLGSLYTGKRLPPLPHPPDHENRRKLIATRSGNTILFEDLEPGPVLTIFQQRDGARTNQVRLVAGNEAAIEITSEGTVRLTSTGKGPVILSRGGGSIEIDKEGKITIKGKELVLESSGKISGQAGDEMVLKGSKIKLN